MTTAELHKILDNENRKLSLDELKQAIYKLKQDAFNEGDRIIDKWLSNKHTTDEQDEKYYRDSGFYDGEQNAFQIALDLLEHFKEKSK